MKNLFHGAPHKYLLWGGVLTITSRDCGGSVTHPDPSPFFYAPWSISQDERGETAAKHSRVSLPTGCARNWCMDGPRVYLLDDQVQACPFKRIRSVSLRPKGTHMMISDELAMLFNVTKREVLLLPGCPQLTLHHTALGTVSITFDKRAAWLPEVVSQDIRSNQDLIPTLKYLEHKNARALSDLNNRVENGGCEVYSVTMCNAIFVIHASNRFILIICMLTQPG